MNINKVDLHLNILYEHCNRLSKDFREYARKQTTGANIHFMNQTSYRLDCLSSKVKQILEYHKEEKVKEEVI